MDSRDDLENWSELSLIPQLTHFAFNDTDFGPLCGELLETCRPLAVLVFLRSQAQGGLRINASQAAELSKDPRLVEMRCVYYLLDWQMGAHAGKDYWSRTESFIAKRRSGEIDVLQYQIPDEKHLTAFSCVLDTWWSRMTEARVMAHQYILISSPVQNGREYPSP
ncbi:hypothetical protein C8R44DRAFT_933490 [Mycena epipterygia]|nr:hypothetical protein C8R44DRAFT_933490 [Mycena epipterygia]